MTEQTIPEAIPDTEEAPPRRGGIRGLFDELLRDLRSNPGPQWTWTDLGTLLIICVLLTLFYYYGRPHFFRYNMWREVAGVFGISNKDQYYRLMPYGWWAFASVVLRMVIPCMIIVFVFKDEIRDYGYRIKGEARHFKIYLFLYFFMLPLVVGVSFTNSFQKKYPFYQGSAESIEQFIAYQSLYGIQFMALEAFFRGFILFALFKRFGYYAVPIMTVPYCMIHFGKPILETLGAVFAGLALGYLALKSKSWTGGALLHWSVGITMDLLAIFHRGGFKN